jgi:hypothetical protein
LMRAMSWGSVDVPVAMASLTRWIASRSSLVRSKPPIAGCSALRSLYRHEKSAQQKTYLSG